MKKIKTVRFISIFVSLTVALTVVFNRSANIVAAGELPGKNTAARHRVCTALSEAALNYYRGEYSYENLISLPGAADNSNSGAAAENNQLYSALKTLMSETHTYYTKYSGYSKGSLAYYWQNTDAVLGGASYIMFYSDILGDSEGAKLNREHIWPKSRASFATANGGADLHHLRPALESVNKAKSDHTFGYINGTFSGGYKVGSAGGEDCYYLHTKKDLFECKDSVKGDVARILLYVYCRWGQPNLYSSISSGLPDPDSDDTQNTGEKVIESLDTLLLWCESDPVDEWEMARNDAAEQVQGNRNVFIDYPELAWRMFGVSTPEGMKTPTQTGCEHSFSLAARQDPSYEKSGYFTVRCEKCGNKRTRTLALYDADNPMPSHIPGDINGDDAVNNKDLTRLFQYLSDWDVKVNEDVLDINGDKSVNNKDLTRLFQYLSDWDVAIY